MHTAKVSRYNISVISTFRCGYIFVAVSQGIFVLALSSTNGKTCYLMTNIWHTQWVHMLGFLALRDATITQIAVKFAKE